MQWQSAASWHQFLRQLHGTPSRQSNIIRRSPEPKGAHRRGILFRLCQENRVLSRYAHIAGTSLIFRNNHEPCFPEDEEIGRAPVLTPPTLQTLMPPSPSKKNHPF